MNEASTLLEKEEELQKNRSTLRTKVLDVDAASVIKSMSNAFSQIDAEALSQNPELGQHVVDARNEGLRVSADGWVDDDLCFMKPWGFKLAEIKVPIIFYHGDQDKAVPFDRAKLLAEKLPQDKVKKHLMSNQGHISIFVGQCDAIIDELLAISKTS